MADPVAESMKEVEPTEEEMFTAEEVVDTKAMKNVRV